MRRRLAPQPIAGSAKAVGAARVAIRRQGPLVSRSARHRRGQTVGQILGRLAGGGRRPMEHARGPRHRLALAQQQDTGVIGQDHQRQRSERKGTRPLLPLPGFRQRPGEGRGNGGTRAGRAEMICGVLRCGPGFSGALSGWLGLPVLITALAGEPLEPDRVATMIEAFTRLGPEKVNANPKLKDALAQAEEGAAALLKLAREEKLQQDLKLMAGSELNNVRWAKIKTEAAQLLPLPQGQNSGPVPPISELVKMKGDAAKGAVIYRRDTVGCIKCHQVSGEGVDFGPNLSEIGTKLGKDALYEAILDPSAGVSFGYEAWQIELKNGDEAYGLIVSDTADEIAVKTQGGIVARYKKSDIAKREQQKLSIMPAGLQQTMSTQDLADLVEYLSSLKKPAR